MKTTEEIIVLDPAELLSGRTEFDITPFIAKDGADWGDSAISAYMSEGVRGEYPIDYRVPNRTVSIPLTLTTRATDDGTITGPEARATIQAKVGLWQRDGGTIKRVTNSGEVVFADVVDAAFHATSLKGWESGFEEDTTASITLSLIPDFYGEEITLSDHATTTAAELIWNETGIIGNYPGRVRVVVDEDDNDAQLDLIYGFRSRNYDSASTARTAWEAESLNLHVIGASAALAGASGGNVWAATVPSTSSYTDIIGNDTFTHTGHYRVFARVYSSSLSSVNTDISWAWSVDGGANYIWNDPVRVVGGSVFQILDLGQVDIRQPPIGPHTWIGYIDARSGSGGNLRVDKLWFVPADEYCGVVRGSTAGPALGALQQAELRSEGYFVVNASGNYHERPIYGDLPRLPVPSEAGGTVECFIKASRGVVGDPGTVPTADAAIDDISARITYRPCWLFVPDDTGS